MTDATVSPTFAPSPTTAGQPIAPEGYGTSHFTWGVPAGKAAKSGYTFAHPATAIALDGSEFTLGTLTHANRPLKKPQALNVDLSVRLTLPAQGAAGTAEGAFTFRIRHRAASGAPGTPTAGADTVELSVTTTTETITIDGSPYTMALTGFTTTAGPGLLTSEFASPDGGTKTVTVRARMIATGTPEVRITHIRYQGEVKRTQADEYAELTNTGTATATLDGWTLNAGDDGQDYTFPTGTRLRPGATLRVYTDEIHPESGGHSFASKSAIWNDKGDTAELRAADGTLVASYGYGSHAS